MTDFDDLSIRVLEVVGDKTGVRYTSDQIAEAMRLTLPQFDTYYPQVSTILITLENTARELELDLVVNCKRIIAVVEPASALNNQIEFSPPYYVYFKDAIPWIQFLGTYNPVVGNQLLITYITSHWIDGLDDAEHTTIPYELRSLFIRGCSAYLKQIRAQSQIEQYGVRSPDINRLEESALREIDQFKSDLSCLHSFHMTGFPPGFALDEWDK